MNNVSLNMTYYYTFDGLTGSSGLKVASMAFSAVFIPLDLLLMYSIVWYEHFGNDTKQTMINKFLSSACWTCFYSIIGVQIPELARYALGPLPETVCLLHFTMKNITSIQLVVFFDCIIVARYVYIFWLKNPVAFKDEFWNRFLNIWVVGFSAISQILFVAKPGRQPINYYFCIGKMKPELLDLPVKHHYFTRWVLVVSFVLHVTLFFKIHFFKNKISRQVNADENVTCTRNLELIKIIENQSLTDKTSTFFNFVGIVFNGFLLYKMSRMTPLNINEYPNNVYVYLMHLVSPPFFIFLMGAIYYARNKAMRTTMLRETKVFFRFRGINLDHLHETI